MKYCLAITLLLLGFSAHAEKFALTVSVNVLNQPDAEKELAQVQQFLSGYNSQLLNDSQGTVSAFKEALEKIIASAKPGDQVLLNFMLHGETAAKAEHIIKLSDGNISVSELAPYVKRLEAKGAQIAVLDQSCFSGGSIALASQQTCVASASSAFEVGFAEFRKSLWSEIKSGRSVEESFLAARRKDASLAIPEISTPEGRKLREWMDELVHFSGDATRAWDNQYVGAIYPYAERVNSVNTILSGGTCSVRGQEFTLPIVALAKQRVSLLATPELKKLNELIMQFRVATEKRREVQKQVGPKAADDAAQMTLFNLHKQIIAVERPLYDQLYRGFRQDMRNTPNACQKFKF